MAGGRLAGRIALVTGASRGLGAAVAKRFAAEGAEPARGTGHERDAPGKPSLGHGGQAVSARRESCAGW